MQGGDGGHDRQTKTVSGQASALVEPVEPIDDASPLGGRNAWAIILNDYRDGISLLDRANLYGGPAAGIFQSIVDQVRERAREKVLVAECERPTLDLADEGNSFLLRGGVVELNDIAEHRSKRHGREGLATCPRFGFGDLQQPIEHLNELVDLLDSKTRRACKLRRTVTVAGAQSLFESAPDAP